MQVRFANTRGELFRYYYAFFLRSPVMLLAMGAWAAYLFWTVMKAPPDPANPNVSLVIALTARILVFILTAVCYFAYFSIFLLLSAFYMLFTRASKELRKERVLTLTEAGLASESPSGRSERPWSAILKVRQNHRTIFIVTPQGAVLVPKRAFGSEADSDAFFRIAYENWRRIAVPA